MTRFFNVKTEGTSCHQPIQIVSLRCCNKTGSTSKRC